MVLVSLTRCKPKRHHRFGTSKLFVLSYIFKFSFSANFIRCEGPSRWLVLYFVTQHIGCTCGALYIDAGPDFPVRRKSEGVACRHSGTQTRPEQNSTAWNLISKRVPIIRYPRQIQSRMHKSCRYKVLGLFHIYFSSPLTHHFDKLTARPVNKSLLEQVNMLAYLPLAALVAAAFAAPSPVERSGPVLEAPFPNAPISAPPAATSAPAGPDPSKVTITSIAYGGTGCPQGSVGSFISSDRLTSVISLVVLLRN